MKPKKKTETAAIVTFVEPGNLSAKGRREIAKWLDRQKQFLLEYPGHLTSGSRYTARYEYPA